MPYIEAGHVVEDYEEPEEEEEEEDAEEKKTLSRKEVSPPSKVKCMDAGHTALIWSAKSYASQPFYFGVFMGSAKKAKIECL